ncbi:MAG: hypothetical protein SOR78_07980 [Baileyella intestinalis]|nr:hypothetical protein [Baileyella intestinalis]MDY2995680.1 hypothetical protein [Baileyella intestinalis]
MVPSGMGSIAFPTILVIGNAVAHNKMVPIAYMCITLEFFMMILSKLSYG